ncbi:MAG: hypothetical protein HFH68_02785 [Lachnospiraceae bacterium]|nr:hypothetical protein [Lachnospiraceae bacterium]
MACFKNKGKGRSLIYCTVFLPVFIFISVFLQNKCSNSAVTASEEQSAGVQEEAAEGNGTSSTEDFFLDVRAGFGGKPVIPDPAKTDGKVSISLLSRKNVDKVYNDGKWYKKNGDLYLGTDLSFAGFNRPVFVSSYAIGDMTEDSGTVSYITKKTNKGIKRKKVKGSCLVLFVTTKLEEYEKYDESYFVILDYKNGVSYKKKTTFYLHVSRWVSLSVADVTGDGIQELLLSSLCNKSVDFGLYHADIDKHKIETIYETHTDPGRDFIDRLEFQGKLKDNYKVELKVPRIGYSKIISVIKDGGYGKKNLHNKMDDDFNDVINYIGMWKKNGKLRKKWAKKYGKVFLYTLDDISYSEDKNGNTLIEFIRPVSIGHRSIEIGNMHIYMKYDKDSGKLVAESAKYSNYKESKKEWKTARRKYGGFNWEQTLYWHG